MEKEEFGFSVLQPSLLLIASPAAYYIYTSESYWFFLTHTWLGLFLLLVMSLILWKNLRITFLMLLRKPALVLTSESIKITESNYIIAWEDVLDVYLAGSGSSTRFGGDSGSSRTYYIILKVKDPEKYVKTIKNPFTRYYRWYTRNWRVSLFEVNLFLVKGDSDEIYKEVLKYYQQYGLYYRTH
jgi:hypothetical protein